MKSLSGNASTAASNALGEDPFLVLVVHWAVGDKWYADRNIPSLQAEGRILNAGDLEAQSKLDGLGTVGAIAFTLDDPDGALKSLMDTNCAEGTKATVYQAFESARTLDDLILLTEGVLIDPQWSEGERQFTFEIETRVQELEVGFAIEQETFESLVVTTPLLTDEAIGKAWPLCFGSNVHLPMLKVLAPPETSLNDTFMTDDNHFFVEDASRFPTGNSIDVIIDGMVFDVTVDKANNKMTVNEPNVPKYQNVAFASRVADEDLANPWVAWIAQDVSLANTFIYFETEQGNHVFHRVLRQEGRKIWLDNRVVQRKNGSSRWTTGFGVVPQPLGPPTVISQVAKDGREGWGIEMSYVGGATTSNGRLSIGGFRDTVQVISKVKWKFASGTSVKLWGSPSGSNLHHVKYVANLIPGSELRALFAWRRNPKTGIRTFRCVPTSYYVVDLAESIFGQTALTVTLNVPLTELYAQGWEDTVYASHKSSVGPNVADVIQWLLETYSNIEVDAGSFAAVNALVDKYPVAIVLESKREVLQLCEDIAWKARCALLIEDGVAKLKYLSVEPTSDMSLTEEQLEYKSIHLSSTRTEDIVTHFAAQWRLDYSGRPAKSQTLVKTENVSKFGLRKRSFDFNIYNVKSLVEKSARFWAHRMANSWRMAKLNVLDRNALALEMLDCITLALSDTTMFGTSFKTLVDAHSADRTEDETTFGFRLWLPSVAGTLVQDPNAWLDDSGDVTPDDPVDRLNETTIDEQWSDELSNSYVNQRVAGHPAKIINQSADGMGFNVDVYDDGYEDPDGTPLPPTNLDAAGNRIEFVAYPIEIAMALDRSFPSPGLYAGLEKYRNILQEGTRIQIFNVHGTRWLFNAPATSTHVPAKINGPTPDALGRIGFTLYPAGYDAGGTLTEVKAIFLGDVTGANVGDQVVLFQYGDTKFAIPVSASGTQVKPYQIVTNDGGGNYTAQEFDAPYGVEVGDPVSNLYELNGSVNVEANWWVWGITFGDYIYFDRPLGAC